MGHVGFELLDCCRVDGEQNAAFHFSAPPRSSARSATGPSHTATCNQFALATGGWRAMPHHKDHQERRLCWGRRIPRRSTWCTLSRTADVGRDRRTLVQAPTQTIDLFLVGAPRVSQEQLVGGKLLRPASTRSRRNLVVDIEVAAELQRALPQAPDRSSPAWKRVFSNKQHVAVLFRFRNGGRAPHLAE